MSEPQPSTQDPYKDSSFLRDGAQERHYEEQRLLFMRNFCIESTSPGSEEVIVATLLMVDRLLKGLARCIVANNYYKLITKPLSELSPDDCRQFCYKDCAIYGNAERLGETVPWRVLDDVYKEWFPHRAMDKDVAQGSFFGKYIHFRDPVVPLAEIIGFHERLCEKLKSLEGDVVGRRLVIGGGEEPKEPPTKGLYRLRDTFNLMLIVLDHTSWGGNGVLLVYKDRGIASGLKIDGEVLDIEDVAPARVYRLSLKGAMQAVVSQDKERSKRRREYNDLNNELYGSDSD
ncbi:hypothetical protein OEA41_004679 [Lepraria neglecta]|uniref:Uncharacterized protein n=1 Tax=Lepraria neglecta TaxID=209136 RepID=A0AAD9Z2G4_9LECA|nr:hypothetical protein OEA41_004679 [Lepraria neglecta]